MSSTTRMTAIIGLLVLATNESKRTAAQRDEAAMMFSNYVCDLGVTDTEFNAAVDAVDQWISSR